MKKPPVPDNEPSRIAALQALRLLDTPAEERYDRVTRLAKRSFGVEMALVSLVDEHRQWFKSRQGLEAEQTARELSFCAHAINDPETLVVENALEDERFRNHPLVEAAPNIRFYAGAPIAAPDGSLVGTLCLVDSRPRRLPEGEVALLEDLARLIEAEMTNKTTATTDELTGLSNRTGFVDLTQRTLDLCERCDRRASLVSLSIQDFEELIADHGHQEADRALRVFASFLLETAGAVDLIGRIDADEFAILVSGDDHAENLLGLIDNVLARWNEAPGLPYRLQTVRAIMDFDPGAPESAETLLERARQRLWEKVDRAA